ncbi:ankyrin repeat domain-containing protein, partial [Aspergillus glaucus CBS 516.65]
TPIMTAANHGHVPAIKLLLHHGVDINVPQATCNSPLSLAAIHGHIPAVRTLLHHGADVNTIRRGTTPL